MTAATALDRGRYELVRQLGRGTGGVVYEAFDRERGLAVAVKQLQVDDAERIFRFKAEFRALADVSHPNLVRFEDLFEEGGRWFFTMELVEGVDLLAYVRGGAAAAGFDEARLRESIAQLAAGLAALHAAGKVHRDVKPANVRVSPEGRVVLIDFGFAVDARREVAFDLVVGTPNYMAPEQAAAQPVDSAADMYALGVILYEALTGSLPHTGSALEVLERKQHTQPPTPSTLRAGLPADLENLCLDLLQLDVGARPSAKTTLRRLGRVSSDPDASASRSSMGPATPFVGREAELDWLRLAVAGVSAGAPVTVMLVGDSGVGKSALLRRCLRELRRDDGVLILEGRCHQREALPFKALDGVIDALTAYLHELPDERMADLVPRHAVLLTQAFPVLRQVRALSDLPRLPYTIDPQETRRRVVLALRELLERLGRRLRVVLSIDDLQWTDADSLALLAGLLRAPDAPRIALLATIRDLAPEQLGLPGDVRSLVVGPLSRVEATDLARILCEREGLDGAQLGGQIARVADGHPLYIAEMARHARSSERRSAASLDAGLESALWARIAGLEDAARTVLRVVCVSGAPLPARALGRATGLEASQLARLVSMLRVVQLVRTTGVPPEDTLEPYHDRVRASVLAHLDPDTLRATHRAIALALEAASGDHEALTLHWCGAGDPGRAAPHAERAAEAAAQALAFEHAARFYRLAAEGSAAARRGELLARAGDSLAGAGRGKEAADAYLEAAEGAAAADQLEWRRRAADQLLRSGHVEGGLGAIRDVLARVGMSLPEGPRRTLALLLWRRARVRLRGLRFRLRDATQVAPEALRRIDVCWSVAAGLGMVDTMCAADFQGRTLLLALEAGEPSRVVKALALEIAFSASGGSRTVARTERLFEVVEGLARELADPQAIGLVDATAGIAAYQQGRFRVALERSLTAQHLFRDQCTGVAWELSTVRLFAMWSRYYLGECAMIAREVPMALREAEARGDLYEITALGTGLVNARWLFAGDPAGARRETEQALGRWSHVRFHFQHYWHLLAESQIDLYEGDGAGAFRRLEARWRDLERSLYLRIEAVRVEALHLRARAALAASSDPGAERVASSAVHALGRERVAWARPLALLGQAALARRADDAGEAMALLARAIEGFERAEMQLYAAAARRRLGALRGGDEGRSLVEAASAFMSEQSIRDPAQVTELLAPALAP